MKDAQLRKEKKRGGRKEKKEKSGRCSSRLSQSFNGSSWTGSSWLPVSLALHRPSSLQTVFALGSTRLYTHALRSPARFVGSRQHRKKDTPPLRSTSRVPSKVFLLLNEFLMLERAGPLPAFRALFVVWVPPHDHIRSDNDYTQPECRETGGGVAAGATVVHGWTTKRLCLLSTHASKASASSTRRP